MKKKTSLRRARYLVTVPLLSVGFGLLFAFLFGGFSAFNASGLLRVAIYSLSIGFIAWAGNSLITHWVSRRWPWHVKPGRTFAIALTLGLIYTLVSIGVFNLLFFYPWGAGQVNWPRLWEVVLVNSLVAVIITVIILLLVFQAIFMRYLRNGLQREEQYKRDIITAQYEALRNQVNPHFLFNSLSVLTSLVETDQGAAVSFIRKLSDVYRYVLDMRDRELVTIGEELQLVRSFLFMQQQRFGDQLKVDIGPVNEAGRIVPLSMQMLIENALKHNIASGESPLFIRINEENGLLVCSNNYQPRPLVEPSAGTGLKNIAGRFSAFTAEPVRWGVENGNFVVRIPVIK